MDKSERKRVNICGDADLLELRIE